MVSLFTILIDITVIRFLGNKLICDAQLNWFIDWLVNNKVRTFVPNQPEVKCAMPANKQGTRLKDLMIKHNNATETLINSLNDIPGFPRGMVGGGGGAESANAGNLLANLIPGLSRQAQGSQMGAQMLNSLAQSFPGFRPGMNFLPSTLTPDSPGESTIGQRPLDSAIDKVHSQ
jgi:hypothetical protein